MNLPPSSTRAVAAVVALFCLASPAASFEVEGHRGARWVRPENTLAAFRYALALGVDTLEMALHATKDDIPWDHDPFLNPTGRTPTAGSPRRSSSAASR